MVDVLVFGITATELIVNRTDTEHDGLGLSVLVENHDVILIASHRSIGTADAGHLLGAVFRVLINALVAETVDTTESTVQLNTCQVRAITAVKLIVQSGQTGLVHSSDLVLVVSEGDVEVEGHLADSHDVVTIEVELPTDVLHVTNILIGQCGEAR